MESNICITRYLHASPQDVFDAWLDPRGVGAWWFATPDGEMQEVRLDPRVGGEFLIVEKRGEELAEHFGVFVELERPHHLVFDFAAQKDTPLTRVTVQIEPEGKGSRITLSHELAPEWAEWKSMVMRGWNLILGSLGEVVESQPDFTLNRTFPLSREEVFQALSTEKALRKWFCPISGEVRHFQADVVVGGSYTDEMLCSGSVHRLKGRFLEISWPHRVVLTHQWEREGAPETVVSFDLKEAGKGTELILTQRGLEGEESIKSHNAGWGETLEHLMTVLPYDVKLPTGFATVFPYFFVEDAPGFIEFLIKGLGGEEVLRTTKENGKIANSQIRFGRYAIMVGEPSDAYPPMPTSCYLFVKNVDTVIPRALEMGAVLEMPVMDMPYGDRQGGIRDPWGNLWWISERIADGGYQE